MSKSAKHQIALGLSIVFKAFFKLKYRSAVTFGKRVIINHRFKFKGAGRLIIAADANLWAHKEPNEFFTYSPDAVIKIGERTRLNGVGIQCRESVQIGQDCLVGSAVIMDNDFHSLNFEHRNNPAFIKSAPVHIDDKVWLAGQCAILKGVKIGKEAVVGFRAVVASNVPEKTVVAGNPAIVVKNL